MGLGGGGSPDRWGATETGGSVGFPGGAPADRGGVPRLPVGGDRAAWGGTVLHDVRIWVVAVG